MMIRIFSLLSLLGIISCAPKKVLTSNLVKESTAFINSIQHSFLNDHFMGFVLMDPSNKDKLIDINGDKLFTPASNTKILTYYLSRKVLGDSIPSFDYALRKDSLIIRGTGDPYLFGRFNSGALVESIINNKEQNLYIDNSNYTDKRWGSGWAWDDYTYSYQKEINSIPLFENAVLLSKDSIGTINIFPSYFDLYVKMDSSIASRYAIEELTNEITINPLLLKPNVKYELPFHMTDSIFVNLLSIMLNRHVEIVNRVQMDYKTQYHHSIDTLYKALMVDSDNFIAEQLLLSVAHEIDSILSVKRAIRYGVDHVITNNEMRWVDGSGLSRYNLISPNTICHVLDLILKDFGSEEIKRYFPSGQDGSTLSPIFLSASGEYDSHRPFVYAKTGTLSNVHNLSGYIFCKSGKLLIFSFMNNHYLKSKTEIVKEMHNILSKVYWTY